jgi:hypothetical protein
MNRTISGRLLQHGRRVLGRLCPQQCPFHELPRLPSMDGKAASRMRLKQVFDEPNAEERELIMGFEPSSTAAPNITERQRRALLGQAIDTNALTALWASALLMHKHPTTRKQRASHFVVPPNPAQAREHPIAMACCHWDQDDLDPVLNLEPNVRHDIWEDESTLDLLMEQHMSFDQEEANRARKQAILFGWLNNRLSKVVKDKLTTNRHTESFLPQTTET